MLRNLLVPAICAICAAGACGEPSEADLVLLQPYLNQTPLGSGIEAYTEGDRVLVPLGELCRLLAFGITVDPEGRSASGFFINPHHTFRLDLDKAVVEVAGRHLPMPRVAALAHDLYVDSRSLGDWFPLEVRVDLKGSFMVLKPKEKLPIQEAWERDNRYGSAPMSQYGDDADPKGRPNRAPYSFLDMASIDLATDLQQHSPPASTTVDGTAELGGDLLWMSSDIYASRAYGSWQGSRATLFREDPQAGILGPMKARRVELGDILAVPAMDLVGTLPQGRGLNLDNYPVSFRSRFATRTFRGALPSGWSVEFFQNDSMVAFQRSGSNGLYEFKDVPLRFGLNLFRLVFHGPLGEQRQETYRLDIAQNQPAPGSLYYGLTWVRPTAWEVDSFLPGGTGDSSLLKPAYMIQANYGLSTAFSVLGGAAGMQLQDGFHTYGLAGARYVGRYLVLQMTAAHDQKPVLEPGDAVEGVLTTGIGYASLTLRRDEFRNGFERSIFDTATLGAVGYVVRDATGVGLNWAAPVFRIPFSVSAQVDAEDYVGGARGLRESWTLGTQLANVNLSNSISTLSLPGAPDNPMQGVLTATYFQQSWGCQANLNYERGQLTGWGSQAQFFARDGYQYQFGASGPLGATGPVTVSAGVQRLAGHWGFGLNLERSGSTYAATLRLQIALGREPRTGKWTSNAQSLATNGAMSAVAFLDHNGNGVRDPGEPILEGAKFKVGGTEVANEIKDPRVTLLTRLPKSQPVDVSLDESSLEDPSQKASVKTWSVLPRPGKVERLDFPVTTVGEVNGTTRILRGGKRSEFPGLEVEVLDPNGRRIAVQRSAYDGFFEFGDLPYGDYLLRVTPEETARVKLRPSDPRRIRIDGKHAFLDGLDLVVEPMTERMKP